MQTPALAFISRFLAAATTKPASWAMQALVAALAHFTYFALTGILVIAGLGLPIPEDIPLIMGGYFCSPQHSPIKQIPKYVDIDGDGVKEAIDRPVPNLYLMMLAGMAGVLIGDSIVFSIGRRGIDADNFVARHIRKVMHSKRREKVEHHFAQHGNLTIFVGRFMPGFRSLVFAFAGMSKMSYLRFLLIDGLAALLSVPLFVFLGYHFAGNIGNILGALERIKHILGPILLVVALGAAVIWYLRRKKAAQAATLPATAAPPIDAQ